MITHYFTHCKPRLDLPLVGELEKRRDEFALKPTVVLMYSTSDSLRDEARSTDYDSVAQHIVKGDLPIEVLHE